MSSPSTQPVKLRRTLGLFSCTLMGVGVILGAGIYALVGKVAGLGGSAIWISFLAAAVVAGLTGLSYAELASFIPRAGGEYHYALRAYGRRTAFLVSWLLLGGLAVATGAVALGFGGYFEALTGISAISAATCVLLVCAGLLAYGIRESVFIAGLCTTLEVAGLVAIIAIGVPSVGSVDLLEMPHGIGGLGSAAILVFFAFIGFEEIVQLAEETQNPSKTVPRALLLSIATATVLYVAVAIAAVSVLGWERLGHSKSPLADVAEAAFGATTGTTIALIALFSTFNTVLVLLMSASRLLWGMSEDGAIPVVLARVLPRRRSPWLATIMVAVFAAVVVLVFENIETIAELTNFALFVTFIFINGSVIVLRFREPETERPFRIPGAIGKVPVVPALGVASVAALLTQTRVDVALAGLVLLATGVCGHFVFERFPRA